MSTTVLDADPAPAVTHRAGRGRGRVFGVIAWVVRAAVPVTFALASLGKLGAWSSFNESLDSYTLLPGWIREFAPALPALEVVPLAMLAAGRRWGAQIAGALLLVGLTGLLLAHKAVNHEPNCACFGEWKVFYLLNSDYVEALRRNVALLLVLGLSIAIDVARARLVVREQ